MDQEEANKQVVVPMQEANDDVARLSEKKKLHD